METGCVGGSCVEVVGGEGEEGVVGSGCAGSSCMGGEGSATMALVSS